MHADAVDEKHGHERPRRVQEGLARNASVRVAKPEQRVPKDIQAERVIADSGHARWHSLSELHLPQEAADACKCREAGVPVQTEEIRVSSRQA